MTTQSVATGWLVAKVAAQFSLGWVRAEGWHGGSGAVTDTMDTCACLLPGGGLAARWPNGVRDSSPSRWGW
eukprot:402525-Alexandrium_andersonii.AAC.1